MLKSSEKLRESVAETLFDAANIALGAMVFGQALNDGPFSVRLALLGLAIWIWFVSIGAALIARGAK